MAKDKKEKKTKKNKTRSEIENCCGFKFVEVHVIDWFINDRQISLGSVGNCMELSDGWISGYLVYEDEFKIVIAQQIFDNDSCRACISISKVSIVDRIDYE